MIILLSPAKTLDMDGVDVAATQPRLLPETNKLAARLKRLSVAKLASLMSISEDLAELTYSRNQNFTGENRGKPALLAFKGDVYLDLQAADFNDQEFEFAHQQIRILSGLYGLLRPRDLMEPYRLEMGTKLSTRRGKDLYQFWGDRITNLLNEDLEADESKLLLNLASKEYYKSLKENKINGRVLHIHFREKRNGTYRTISFNAKKARGRMARLITLEGITTAEPLKELVVNEYAYREELSETNDWVFARD